MDTQWAWSPIPCMSTGYWSYLPKCSVSSPQKPWPVAYSLSEALSIVSHHGREVSDRKSIDSMLCACDEHQSVSLSWRTTGGS